MTQQGLQVVAQRLEQIGSGDLTGVETTTWGQVQAILAQ